MVIFQLKQHLLLAIFQKFGCLKNSVKYHHTQNLLCKTDCTQSDRHYTYSTHWKTLQLQCKVTKGLHKCFNPSVNTVDRISYE